MLTDDLIRCQIRGERIEPVTIGKAYWYRALDVINIYKQGVGKSRAQLEKELEKLEETRTDYLVFRGLAKILEEKATFEEISLPADPSKVREKLFSKSSESVYYPDLLHPITSETVIREVAQEYGIEPSYLKENLFADLPENHVLKHFNMSTTPDWLIARYNLALHQAMLYHALKATIQIFDHYSQVFRFIKLYGLMHRIRQIEGGYEIILDGPVSLFRNSQRYGVRLANFLPALVQAKRFSLIAQVERYGQVKTYVLNEREGLSSHYFHPKEFDSKLEEKFYKRFLRTNSEWMIKREEEIIDLGEEVLIPDFTFTHPDGRRKHLEIVGFWTPEYLKKKIDKIQKAARQDLLIAISQYLNCSKKGFEGPVIIYKTSIQVKKVLERLNSGE